MGRADMFVESEDAARDESPRDLVEGRRGIVDRAQHQRQHRCVVLPVSGGQSLGPPGHDRDRDRDAGVSRRALGVAAQARIRLNGQYGPHRLRIVGKVLAKSCRR